jgi:Zn-dependent protease with chaperone function
MVMWTAGAHALWLLPLLLLATPSGTFQLRREIFDETWSFVAYASFTLRLSLGIGAYWIALLAAPWLGEIVSTHALAITLAAAILIATKLLSRQFMARLLALEPWQPEEGEFSAGLARIHSEARIPQPKTFRLPVEGSSWVNALAMPSVREPWVVLSETLLETFEPSEVAAIYAHELAHLEEMDSA